MFYSLKATIADDWGKPLHHQPKDNQNGFVQSMDEHNDRYLHRLFIEVYLGDDMDSPTLEPLLSMWALNSHPRDRRNNISLWSVSFLSFYPSHLFFFQLDLCGRLLCKGWCSVQGGVACQERAIISFYTRLEEHRLKILPFSSNWNFQCQRSYFYLICRDSCLSSRFYVRGINKWHEMILWAWYLSEVGQALCLINILMPCHNAIHHNSQQ